MKLKKIIGFVHLWLGLLSGLVVFIIAVTGCLYVFKTEIENLTQPYRRVTAQHSPLLPPSVIQLAAQKALPGKRIHSVEYGSATSAARATFYSYQPAYHYMVYINPYNAALLQVKDMNSDFFHLVLKGHYYLWLLAKVGKAVTSVATLIFLVLLVTGIVLWWPKTRHAIGQGFAMKWKAGWRRRNYDLHNVLGFYTTWVAIFIVVTGLVWGFQWFAAAVYWTTSGGKSPAVYQQVYSKKPIISQSKTFSAVDTLWKKTLEETPNAATVEVHFPETPQSAIEISTNPDAATYWKTDYRYFDQYTLHEIPVKHLYGRYRNNLPAADKIARLNYDIHVGSILGLPGKLLVFFASLLCASLPVTGVFVWWNKRRQTRTSLTSNLA
jgi:uncharacterized iron-regulated membrane protein